MGEKSQQLLEEALRLSSEERALLAEKLVESLVTAIDPAIERAHLQAVEERQTAYRDGRTQLIDEEEVRKQIRADLGREVR